MIAKGGSPTCCGQRDDWSTCRSAPGCSSDKRAAKDVFVVLYRSMCPVDSEVESVSMGDSM